MQQRNLFASISVGVKDEEFDFIEALAAANLTPEYITIDIAHGHAQIVIDMIHHIKHYLPNAFVIAGNVGTPEGVRELENAGADATKVGIGPGKVCITKIKPVLGLVAGSWPPCAGVQKPLASRLSPMAAFAPTATSPSRFALAPPCA